jgi:hypothetical protein
VFFEAVALLGGEFTVDVFIGTGHDVFNSRRRVFQGIK